MQQIYLEDYDVNLEFPDQMSEDRIKDIIKRDYPEPDEKLVARFDNPDTPSSSLTREDFVRYKQARPDMTWGQVPGVVAEAAVDTAARIVNNLPDAVRTYANIFDPGTSARTFLEGAARGTYDTETLIQMAKGYIGSKIDAFGGVSEDETTNQYNNFVKLKELQNVRGAIERGDKSAWNEYADWAGMAGAKLDLAKINTQAAELTGEFIDPTFFVPGGKIASKASRAAARTLGAPVRAAGRAASIASEYTGGLIEGAKNRVKGATEIIDEATGGLANVVVPGGVGAAVAGGVVGGGTAGLVGAAVATPTLLDVAGGLLTGFGEAMSHTPTRLGGLARVHMHQPDTIAGKLAGRLQFLDRPVDYAGRAATGAAIGGAIGGGIGLASGGLEGLAQGIGSGGVLGAGGATLGRAVEGLTGASLRNAQDSDYNRWIETKSAEDRERLASISSREDRIARMDAEQILLQGSATVRHVDPDFVVDQKGTKLGKAAGFLGEEDGKPVVYLNVNADAQTMLHETFHAMARLDGFDAMVSTIKNTIGRMYSPEQVNDFIRDYENRLGKQIDISQRYQEKMGGSSQAKVDYILEEMGAEYFANFIKGKNSNYIFSGSSFAEGLKGVFDRFTKGKLDRVYDAFQSPIFDQQIRQSRRLDSAMRDLVKARREAGRKVDLSIDEPVKTYSAVDLADDDTFREMEAMGVAKTDRSGKRVIMGDSEQKKIAKERARTITNILDQVGGEGGLTRQPDGSYRGARFSAGQLQALLDSPLINDTIKKALAEYSKINEADQYVNVTYGAATMKTKLGKTRAKNIPISNRNAILYDLVISPITGTITARVLDMSLTESKARRLYNQTPEMQKIFGSEAQMFLDLHSYLNALRSGEKRTAEVLGSQRKSDYLNKVLSVRNVKGNPEVPEGTMTARQRRLFEGGKDFPWRSFRLDRIVALQQKEGRPIVSFSEAAYQRAQTHFTPIGGSRTVSDKPYSMAANGGFTTAPGTIRFVPVYHGSPHKFDEFSLSKIGTGEGATAYGYGLYFAEDKKVADHYRKTLTPDMVVNNELMPPSWEFKVGPLQADLHSNIKYYFERIKNGLDTDYAQRQVERKMSQLEDSVYEPVIRLMDFYNRNKGASKDSITEPKGNLYEVDFDADESTLIKWDENYDNQSDFVKSSIDRMADSLGVTRDNYKSFLDESERLAEAALLQSDPQHPDSLAFDTFYRSKELKVAKLFEQIHGTYSFDERPMRKNLTGQKIYAALEFVGDSIKDRQKNASDLLNVYGIKGIKYKDGMSRKASGEEVQTFNYVAFNDADIKIKTRNGEEINISRRDEPAQGAGFRFSPAKLDTDHAKAVQSGDMETAQRLVDEAAKKAGYTVGPVYHGGSFNIESDPVFRVPSGPKRKNKWQLGFGTHFATDVAQTDPYLKRGGKVATVYLKDNIFDADSNAVMSSDELSKWPKSVLSRIDKFNRQWKNDTTYAHQIATVLDQMPPNLASSAVKEAGYDGIKYQARANLDNRSYMPFEAYTIVSGPSAIKSADPATYDDNGNLIPLSERFNIQSDDIRFSPERPVHRRHTGELSKNDVILFADDPMRNQGYGSYVWELGQDLPEPPDEVVRFAAQYYDVDLDEARQLVDPENIVDSAGAWDDRGFVSDLWQAWEQGQIKTEPSGFKTQDGAVVIDRYSVKIDYLGEPDDIRFSPAADRPSIVQRKLNDPSESGTILNGVVSLTPSVMARFSPATNDPGYDIKQLAGKKAFVMMADRMKVGEYTARSGRVFELRGGPDHPDLADNQGIIAWAVEGGPIASQLETAIRQTDGIGLVVLQKEESVAGNKTYSEIMLEEFKYDMQQNPQIKKDLPKILEKASAMIQKKAKAERLKSNKLKAEQAKAKGKKFTPKGPSKWESFEFKSVEHLEEALPEMTFGGRKTMWQQVASNDYKKKYGGIFWKDMYDKLNAYKDDQGYRTGDIVKVIQFDKSAPTPIINPKDLGLPVHPAYQHGVLGKSISNIKGRLSAFDLLRDSFINRIDEESGIMKPGQQITPEGKIGAQVHRVMALKGLTEEAMQPVLTETSLDPRSYKSPVKLGSDYGVARTKQQEQIRSEANRFSPQRTLNNRGGAVYTTAEGHRAVQTSSRAGVRVYGPTGRRIGPVFQSVEAAERHLSQQ